MNYIIVERVYVYHGESCLCSLVPPFASSHVASLMWPQFFQQHVKPVYQSGMFQLQDQHMARSFSVAAARFESASVV